VWLLSFSKQLDRGTPLTTHTHKSVWRYFCQRTRGVVMMEAMSTNFQNPQSAASLPYFDRHNDASGKFAEEKNLFQFVTQTNEINKQVAPSD
jgi:hypothetical protein